MIDRLIDWWDRYKLWRYAGPLQALCVILLFMAIGTSVNWWYGEKTGTSGPQVVAPLSAVPTQTSVANAPIRQSEQIFADMKKRIKALSEQVEKQRVQLELAKHELEQFRVAKPVDMKAEREVGKYAKDVLGDLGLKSVTVVNR